MKKIKIDPLSQESDGKSNQPELAKEGENPYNKSWFPLPVKPIKNIPVKADLDNRRSIKNRPHLH